MADKNNDTDKDNFTPGTSFREAAAQTVTPYAERIIRYAIEMFADTRPIKAIIRDLNPEMIELLYQGLPGIGGFATTMIPDAAFRSAESAMLFKELIRETFKAVADTLKKNKDASQAEIMEAVEGAIKKVESTMVLIDQLGHFHLADCVRARTAIGGGQNNNRNRNQPQAPARNESTLKAVIDQGLLVSPCCYKRVEEEKAKASCDEGKAKPNVKANGQRLSPLEVIGAADKELREKFTAWLDSLSPKKRKQAWEALHELDSVDEFIGLMELSPQLRMQALPALENRHGKKTVKHVLGLIGKAIKGGAKEVVKVLKASVTSFIEWDKQFADRAQDVRNARQVPVEQRIAEKRQKRHVPWSLKMFLPF